MDIPFIILIILYIENDVTYERAKNKREKKMRNMIGKRSEKKEKKKGKYGMLSCSYINY